MKKSFWIIIIGILAVALTGIGAFCEPNDIPPDFLEKQSLPEADIADDIESSTPEEKPPENNDPVINSIEIRDNYDIVWRLEVLPDGPMVVIGQFDYPPLPFKLFTTTNLKFPFSYELYVDAIDPDGDSLKYNWDILEYDCNECINLGTYSHPNQPMTTWTPPEKLGTYTLDITVDDGKGGEDSEDLFLIEVLDSSVLQRAEVEIIEKESGFIELEKGFFYGFPLFIGDSNYDNPVLALANFPMDDFWGTVIMGAELDIFVIDENISKNEVFLTDLQIATLNDEYFLNNPFWDMDTDFEEPPLLLNDENGAWLDVFNFDSTFRMALAEVFAELDSEFPDVGALITNPSQNLRGSKIIDEYKRLPTIVWLENMPTDDNGEWDGALVDIILTFDYYRPPSEPIQKESDVIGGIGTYLFQDEEGNIIVDELVPGGSAGDAGIKKDDQVIKVDGIDIEGMDLDTVADMIIGPVGSEVVVTFLQAGEVALLRRPLPEEALEEEKSIDKETIEETIEESESQETTDIQIPEELSSIEPYEIEIIGDDDFVEETNKALDLLESKAPLFHAIVVRYIGAIKWVERGSGMAAYEDPPLYMVGKTTVGAGTIWYAGTIVHDSIHSKQYHDYLAENPSGPVPNEVWTGESSEAQCLSVQYDALEKIGASQQTLDYIKKAIKTKYWEVDYEERWW